MPQSESVAKIIPALSKAQAKFTPIKKDKIGQEGNLKFPYSTLPEGLAAVRQYLNAEGIYLSQPVTLTDSGLRVITKLQLGDEWLASDGFPLPNIEPGKLLGKTLTYGRRIDLFSFLSICGEDDDEDAPDLKPGPDKKPDQPNFAKGGNVPKVNQIPAKPSNTARPGEFKDVLKNPGPELIKIPAILTETTVGYQSQEVPVTGYEKGKIDNISVVGGNLNPGTPGITDDDLPVMDGPLQDRSSWPTDVPEDVFDHRPLTAERYEQIQNRLKDLISNKEFTLRNLTKFLEIRHKNKRAFDVPAFQWEETVKRIEDAVSTGQDAVKVLLGITKS